jgi:hypothetical protein
MSLRQNATVIGIALILGGGAAFGQRVAVMASPATPAWNGEVQSKLIATGFFSVVDRFDIQSVTPTLSEMQSYCAVLAYTDDVRFDSTTFGNNLANYVDSGGGVVAALFATSTFPWGGRFAADDYWAIEPNGGNPGPEETLGTIFVPGHPILNGVSTFDGGPSSFRPAGGAVLHAGATRVADWTGGDSTPIIVTRTIGAAQRVDLGFYPPSSDSRSDFWQSNTDGARIMANALLYACRAQPRAAAPALSPSSLVLLAALLAGAGCLSLWRSVRRV